MQSVGRHAHDGNRKAAMQSLMQDLRFSLRQIRRSPGFMVTAVLTLALGVGANTAIFSLLDQALLRSLPVRDPEQLVILSAPGKAWEGTPATMARERKSPSRIRCTGICAIGDGVRWADRDVAGRGRDCAERRVEPRECRDRQRELLQRAWRAGGKGRLLPRQTIRRPAAIPWRW